ncbi:Septal ring factor EnvC, activator of murein hydrolases AmiA and AmiB [Fontimonas thermophila]|uniref:Septal ring factor EnvC, activator of murein hydrolases AmiA and AmiB n=1 Tax=Fontimonas thermophila TaxID=1076937 RepID=A0A1I2J970_9GAMM|nr:peptidoglycan DD-metalloendopeptidase family protein [Fontimonas thermophila]SFF51315.1 Septal ring factor EnvC, activator of murein hydrolases AmiA and AmiB [Fontimonas thermophila]
MNRLGLLAVLLCWLAAGTALSASTELRQRQEALEQVQARIAELTKSIEADQAQRDALAADLQDLERRIAATGRELKALQQQAAAQRSRIHDTETEILAARRALERHTANLRQQLRAAYVIGRQGRTQLLLNQSDVHKVGRVLVYYDYLQRAQRTAIEGIRARVDTLEALSERLQAEVARLTELKAQQEAALAQLKVSRDQRAKLLQQLRARLADEEGELKRLQADERAIRQLIERLQDSFADLPPDVGFSDQPFASLRGKLPWPVRGRLIARYGEPKAGGKLTWKGHWIGTQEGTAIKAVARGRVVYVGWMHRYGLIVLLEHEGGYYSLYGHAQAANVAIGDKVRAGQVIASAGSTGGHDQPGVYFELRKGTEPIDPRLWLAR